MDIVDNIKDYLAIVDEKINGIDECLATAEEDVVKDLDLLIASKFGSVDDAAISQRLNDFKEQNKTILLQSKKLSLEKAKREFLSLKTDLTIFLKALPQAASQARH